MKIKKIQIILIAVTLSGFLTSCVSIFRQMKEKRDNNYRQGLALYKEKNYREANKKFATVVSIDPEYKKAGLYLDRTGNYIKREDRERKQKEHATEQVIRRDYYAAMVYKNKKKYDAALTMFLRVQSQDPDYEDIDDQIDECRTHLTWKYDRIVDRARDYYSNKKYQKAYSACLEAKKYNPGGREVDSLLKKIGTALNKETEPYRKRAAYYHSKGNYKRTIEESQKALAINPDDSESLELITSSTRLMTIDNEYQQALTYYYKKDYYTAYIRFLSVNRKEKGYRNTENNLENLLALLKKNIQIYYNNGLRYYEAEKFSEAINEWDKVLMIYPGHTEASQYRERAQAKLEIMNSLKK